MADRNLSEVWILNPKRRRMQTADRTTRRTRGRADEASRGGVISGTYGERTSGLKKEERRRASLVADTKSGNGKTR